MAEAYKTVEIPAHVPGIGYTLKHRKAVALLIQYYCPRAVGKRDGNGEVFTREDCQIMMNRAKCHDMDKVLTSLCYPQLTADYLHRMFNGHHSEGFVGGSSKYDFIEMIFDWESAPYTKPDKGMNANGVLESFNQHLQPFCIPYLALFGFKDSSPRVIPEIQKACTGPVYETDLVNAIIDYMHTTNIPQLEYVSRMDDAMYKQMSGVQMVPLRHKMTWGVGGNTFSRPNTEVMKRRSWVARDFVKGTFEAQVFDMDAICKLHKADIANYEMQAKNIITKMGRNHR